MRLELRLRLLAKLLLTPMQHVDAVDLDLIKVAAAVYLDLEAVPRCHHILARACAYNIAAPTAVRIVAVVAAVDPIDSVTTVNRLLTANAKPHTIKHITRRWEALGSFRS